MLIALCQNTFNKVTEGNWARCKSLIVKKKKKKKVVLHDLEHAMLQQEQLQTEKQMIKVH